MNKVKYQLKCEDCGCTWGIFTNGKSSTGSDINSIIEVHELNCTPE